MPSRLNYGQTLSHFHESQVLWLGSGPFVLSMKSPLDKSIFKEILLVWPFWLTSTTRSIIWLMWGFWFYKLHNNIMVVPKLSIFYHNLPINIWDIPFTNEKAMIVMDITWSKDFTFSWLKWVEAKCLSRSIIFQ
jgi:hypothetical protein